MVFRCPNIQAHYNEAVLCLNFLRHLKIMNFPFGTNGKFIILGVPILKHFRVYFITGHEQTESAISFLVSDFLVTSGQSCVKDHL